MSYYIFPTMAQGLPHLSPFTPVRRSSLHDSGYHTPGESSQFRDISATVSGLHPIGSSPILGHHLYGSRIPSAVPYLTPSQYMTSTPLMHNAAAFFDPVPSSAPLTTTGDAAFDGRSKREGERSVNHPRLSLPMVPHALVPHSMVPHPVVPHSMVPHPHPAVPFAVLPTFTGFSQYPLYQLQVPPQQLPLDLSDDSRKMTPKSLFRGETDDDDDDDSGQHSEDDEDKKNPFGMNKILGVSKSPKTVEAQIANKEDFGKEIPVSPPCENKRRRRSSSSSSETSTAQPAKRAHHTKFGLNELKESSAVFRDCPEKVQYVKNEKYQVPDLPEDRTEREKLSVELLRLFQNSDLPPVPLSLRNNVTGLRFYPNMFNLRQASEDYDSTDLVVSPGGLAFKNPSAIEDNKIVDSLQEKRGSWFYCLGNKRINGETSKCTVKAKTIGKMRRHVKNHLPDKKWVCCFCRVQMTDQTDMARHGTTHTMLRPFGCDVCDKKFSQKVTLYNHIKTNHGMSPKKETGKDRFTCRPCGVHYTSTQRIECIEHFKKFHLDTLYVTLNKNKRFPFSGDMDGHV